MDIKIKLTWENFFRTIGVITLFSLLMIYINSEVLQSFIVDVLKFISQYAKDNLTDLSLLGAFAFCVLIILIGFSYYFIPLLIVMLIPSLLLKKKDWEKEMEKEIKEIKDKYKVISYQNKIKEIKKKK